MDQRAKTGLLLAFCSSLGVHGVAFASLPSGQRDFSTRYANSEVTIEVKPSASVTPLSEPVAKSPEPAVLKVAAATPQRAAVAPAIAPTRAAQMPTAARVFDLSGVTLTNDSGDGFALPSGDGSALHGPIGFGQQPPEAGPAMNPTIGKPRLPALVPTDSLSEHPKPPALAQLLRANYPDEARQRGLSGIASVRARIDQDGVIREAQVRSESASGFGAACRRTVLGSHWSAPRDKNGGAVATEIVYTCHFEVDP